MTRLIHWAAVLIASLALTACGINPTTAPYAGEDQGLVIFGADIKLFNDTELEYDYLFTVENIDTGETRRLRMTVEENKPFAVLGRLAPGDYRFVKREDARRDGRGFRLNDAGGEFHVEAGMITMPKLIMVEKHLYNRFVEVSDLSGDDRHLVYDTDIAPRDEFQGWRLLDSE